MTAINDSHFTTKQVIKGFNDLGKVIKKLGIITMEINTLEESIIILKDLENIINTELYESKKIKSYRRCISKIEYYLTVRYEVVDKNELRQLIYGQLDRLNIKLRSIREDKTK